jgi:multidrug efflux pump subunit AcrB
MVAVQQQNAQVAAGQIGQPPVPTGQVYQYTMSTKGRLTDVDEFSDMILRSDPDGRVIRLRDVARPELGAQSYDQTCTLDGQPSVALSVYQRPGTNALNTAKLVRDKMEELKERFPDGVDYAIVYDTTPFIDESVREVFNTLRDAVILVAVVVLLFLQNWRSALIPLVAVPVAIVGTFAVMAAIGFSLNNLTLFGLVLAIGIVVDDAIVVVEAVEHHIEHGMEPKEATSRAMEEVSGPVIAIGLVLAAVFVPCAIISGIIGQFFKQFALTIAASTLISTFNSLTLSPALAALLLRPRRAGERVDPLPRLAFSLMGAWLAGRYLSGMVETFLKDRNIMLAEILPEWWVVAVVSILGAIVAFPIGRPLNRILSGAFQAFNVGFQKTTDAYVWVVGLLLRGSVLVLVLYGGLLYLTYEGLTRTPTGFIPSQDKGYLLVNIQLSDSASLEKTEDIVRRAEAVSRKVPGVKHTLAIAGQSILLGANAPNFGSIYVILDEFHHRTSQEVSGVAIAGRLLQDLQAEISDGLIGVFGAPPVEGLGTAGGFKIILEDRGASGLDTLQREADRIVSSGSETGVLTGLFTSFRARTPWLFLDIDRQMAKTMGVSMGEVFDTLQVYLGSLYVNDFNLFGRTWQVNIQGDAQFRRQVEDLKRLKFRGENGQMVPLAAICSFKEQSGPVMISRYNMYPAAAINGAPAPGISSGQSLDAMESVIEKDLNNAMAWEWTELALLQRQTGNTAMYAFSLAVILVFLVLAAQYESWALPLAVILVVPMCLLCSVTGVSASGMDINIFTQIGFIVLVGLACKNAILIVEFAKAKREEGVPRREATLQACQLRLRPIVMTSFAFILGVVPLVLAEGAGAEMRQTLGTAVFGGMLGVTAFGVFLTPVFFNVIQWMSDRNARTTDVATESGELNSEKQDHT